MVWGAISYQGVGPLIRCTDRMNQLEYKAILQKALHAYPRLSSRATNHLILQHDNAACHAAQSIETFLRSKNVTLLPWPALSPDLSPIENVWAYIAQKMKGKCFQSLDDVWAEVQHQWSQVPVSYIQGLYDSMPNRLGAVKEALGWPTKY